MKRMIALLFILSAAVLSPVAVQAEDKKNVDKPPYSLTDEQLDNLLLDKKIDEPKKEGEEAATPKKFVWVVYFHRTPGCDTCQLMSKYVFDIIKTKFGEDVKTREILLRYRNFEEKKNADLIKKLNVKSPSLAITVVEDGKLVKAKMAGQIWSLAVEKEKFFDYVTKEIEAYKKELKEEKK